jgi:osmotically inducible protein OsmC
MEHDMAIRTANAEWRGNLAQGKGRVRLGAGAYLGTCDFASRMGDGMGTNPEELLGAAHAGCFSMALAHELSKAGATVEHIHTSAKVHFDEHDGGWSIPRIDLVTEASASGVTPAAFEAHAQNAKKNCPVSRALTGVDIRLQAKLL